MMAKFQKFGGAMFVPVVFFVFSGIVVGLSSVATNPEIIGRIAQNGTAWEAIWKVIDAGGWTVFNNMEILFVIGLPLGLAHHAKDRAALESFVIYMTFNNFINALLSQFGSFFGVKFNQAASEAVPSGLKVIGGIKTLDTGVIGAIIIACIAVWLHNRFFEVKLPDWLGIFQGSAFVAMMGFFTMIPMAVLISFIWPKFQLGVTAIQRFMVHSGELGIFLFTFLEKALLPTGLHHFVYVPFQYGPAVVEPGTTLYWIQNLGKFATSKSSLTSLFPAGGFAMQGVSNIFAIPGMAAAFYFTAKKKNRPKVLGLVVPGVLTAALAGITEPFDYTYLFLAPQLFLIHATLCAIEVVVMYRFGITGDMQGGLIEMAAKNFVPLWHNHWKSYILFVIIGICFSLIYFFVFRFFILKFDIQTPGRSDTKAIKLFSKQDYKNQKGKTKVEPEKQGANPYIQRARDFVKLLGGSQNISEINNCVTRLRITVVDPSKIEPDDDQFLAAGAKGIMRNGDAIQIVVGMDSSNVKSEIDEIIND